MNKSRWVPLFDGARAAQARAVVFEIATALEEQASNQLPGLKGDAAIALLLARCGRPTASARLEAALIATVTQPYTLSLFGGISGTSWVLRHLAEGDEAEEAVAHFDAAVLRHLAVSRWKERHDLMSGLAGVGVHVADRRDRRALQIADYVLSHLEATMVVQDTGVTWRTLPQFLPETRRSRYPDGVVDLGVAHGVPGVIGMLTQFVEADMEPARSRRLLEPAVEWLLNSVPARSPRFGSNWPTSHDECEFKRIGWCYGDAGVAGVLIGASRALGSVRLQNESLKLLQQMAAPLAKQGIPDASFCHGAAGLAQIYNVAFQHTGCAQMRREAEFWLAEVLRLRSPGIGIAGFASLKIDGGAPRPEADTTLLSGVVGIALVLLAAIEDREPEWQRLFLL